MPAGTRCEREVIDAAVRIFPFIMNPIIDIISITKDDFDGIRSTIQSTAKIRNETGVRQIIVDGSGEDTSSRIKELLTREPNIEYIWQQPSGISAAFNLGLSMSKAGWVWFLNGRDRVHPDMSAGLFLNILRASNADILIFELEFMQSRKRYKHAPLYAMGPLVLVKNWVPHPATLIRRRLFEVYGEFDTQYKIAMDCEMWVRLFSGKDIAVDLISIPIVSFDENGISATQRRMVAQEMKKIMISNFWKFGRMWLTTGRCLLGALKQYHNQSKLDR